MANVIVVGAGLSGLSAAYRLGQAGHLVTVLERSSSVGGSARTERHGDYLVDTGPDLLNTGYARYLALAREVGLSDSIVESNRTVDVVREGRVASFNSAHPASVVTTSLLSPAGKARLARGHLRTRKQIREMDPFAMTRYGEEGKQPARDYAVSNFGVEAAEQLIDPVVRAFAGTGLAHTNAAAVMAALAVGRFPPVSVIGGMQALPEALASHLDVARGIGVEGIRETEAEVVLATSDGEMRADACLLAVMHGDAAPMWPTLNDVAPDFAAGLVPVPLLSVSLGYRAAVSTQAYSLLIPTREEPDALLGFLQQHKAPDRAPAGATLITLYTEAMSTPKFMGLADGEIVAWADALATRWYPQLAGQRDLEVVTRWPCTGYLPNRGFFDRVAALRKALPNGRVQATSTLFGSGSVERAVVGGERAAQRLLSTLSPSGELLDVPASG